LSRHHHSLAFPVFASLVGQAAMQALVFQQAVQVLVLVELQELVQVLPEVLVGLR
jgi:hypothetical protein